MKNVDANNPISFFSQKDNEHKRFHLSIFLLVLVSLIVDIDWLISDYFPTSLDSMVDKDVFRFVQGESLTRTIIWYTTILAMFCKVIPIFMTIKRSTKGKHLIRQIWSKTYAFFPPLSSSEMNWKALQERTIAIIWLEILCAITIVSLTIYAQVHLSWSPIFTSAATSLTPLINILFCKGISGMLFVLGLLQHTDLVAVFSECLCLKSIYVDYQNDDGSEGDEDEEHTRVLIDKPFLRFNGFLKVVDMIISIIALISLIQSKQLGGYDQPKDVRLVLGLIMVSLVLSSIYGFFLASIVFWLVYDIFDYFETFTQISSSHTSLFVSVWQIQF